MLGSTIETTHVRELKRDSIPLSVGEVAKHIACPKCGKGIYLKAKDFKIDTDVDGTWCADFSVKCPHRCHAHFWIIWSEIVWV